MAWYFGPTRVAARGKIRSSGSVSKISKCSARDVLLRANTHRAYLPQTCTACAPSPSVPCPLSRRDAVRRRTTTYPKYRKGHILKCLISTFSSFSASTRSFLGRPRPRAAGALVFTTFGGTGVRCRTSCPSTSSSCAREQGAHVHPYPRLGFDSIGGFTHSM